MSMVKIVAIVSMVLAISACMTAVPRPSEVKTNTAFALGLDESDVELRDLVSDRTRTRYKAIANGKTFNCYVTGGVPMMFGVIPAGLSAMSDAVCNAPGGQANRNPLTGR